MFVYCAVRTVCLNVISVILVLRGFMQEQNFLT
jgi:hypothetical protein